MTLEKFNQELFSKTGLNVSWFNTTGIVNLPNGNIAEIVISEFGRRGNLDGYNVKIINPKRGLVTQMPFKFAYYLNEVTGSNLVTTGNQMAVDGDGNFIDDGEDSENSVETSDFFTIRSKTLKERDLSDVKNFWYHSIPSEEELESFSNKVAHFVTLFGV